jgi:hypothetical protein
MNAYMSQRVLLCHGPPPSLQPQPKTEARRVAPISALMAVVDNKQKGLRKKKKCALHPQLLKPPCNTVRPKGSASRSASAATPSAATTAQQQTMPKSHSMRQYPTRKLRTRIPSDVSTLLYSEPKKKPRRQLPRPIQRSAATADNAKGSAPVSPGRMLPASPPGLSPHFNEICLHSKKPSQCRTHRPNPASAKHSPNQAPKPSTSRGGGGPIRRVHSRRTSAAGPSRRG